MMVYAKRLWTHFLTDNLFRTSIYLMLTTAAMGGLGFFFWLICAHLFTPEQIGVGTTLISAMSLISLISMLGFNSTFTRILPNSKNRNNEINTGSILVILTSMVFAAIYLIAVPYLAPKMDVIDTNFWYAAGFVVMVALASINSLTDSIFTAYRAAEYTLITDGFITSGTKLFLPLAFIALGAYGVFTAAGLAASIGMLASILFLVWKFGYKPKLKINIQTLRDVFHYSFTNYIANLFAIIPTFILPIIVLDGLGAASAGYFFLAFMVVNLIYTVSSSVAQSLFVEGSYEVIPLGTLLKRSAVLLTSIMLPAAVIFAIAGPFVLGFFGKAYSAGGSGVIIILALAAPAVAGFDIGNTLLRITRQVYSLVIVNLFYAIVVCACALAWAERGILWVALAWLTGNILAAGLSFLLVFQGHRRHLRV
jgi:O-antigen/teichoic acid export membrane protein